MIDEFSELQDMLSLDREEVKEIKKHYEEDLPILIGKIKSYTINSVDISSEYDLENNFDQYKVDDIFLRYFLNKDAIEYKILLMQEYLQDLFMEKKFNEYRKSEEEKLSKNEYLEYINNPNVRTDKINMWYKDFLNK